MCASVASLMGILLVLYGTSLWGSSISPDSTVYIAVAQNIARGVGFQDQRGFLFVTWPPLFPTALAALSVLGLDMPQAGRYLNATVFGLIVFSTYRLLHRYVGSSALQVAGTLFTLVSLCLLTICSAIWSEPLFVLFSILLLIWLTDYWVRPTLPMLLLAAFATALACLTRYAGMPLIVAGTALILWRQRRNLGSAIVHGGLYALASTGPLAAWLARNYLYAHTLTGPRPASVNTVTGSLRLMADEITGWFLPQGLPLPVRAGLIGALLLAVLLAYSRLPRRSPAIGVIPGPLLIPVTIVLGYLGFLIVSAVRVAMDPIDDRLVAPAYPMCICVLFCLVDRFLTHLLAAPRHAWIGSTLVPVVAFLGLIYPGAKSAGNIRLWARQGAGGYNLTVWRHSPLIDFLRNHHLDGPVCSNVPDGLWILTGLDVATSPDRNDRQSINRLVKHVVDARPVYLAWSTRKKRPQRYTPEELAGWVDMQPAYTFPDGTIYRVGPLRTPATHPD